MKQGQIFTFDVMFAFIGLCCIAALFFANFSIIVHQTKEDYDDFILQKKLLDASEFLIQNQGNHHVLDLNNINKDKLLLDDYDVQIKVEKLDGRVLLNEGPAIEGLSVRRAAICGGAECVLEIRAKEKE